jgi:hypothetical protein
MGSRIRRLKLPCGAFAGGVVDMSAIDETKNGQEGNGWNAVA